MVSALSLMQSGKLKALAVGTAKRSTSLPQVPTTVEAGVPGSEYLFWVGLFAPAKTPGGHRRAAARRGGEDHGLGRDEGAARQARRRALPHAPAAFDKFIVDETAKAQQIVRAAGIKVN